MWTPAAALPDSQAGTAYYYRVVPCSYQKCEALDARPALLRQAQPQGGPQAGAAHAGGRRGAGELPDDPTPAPNQQVCQNDVTLSWEDYRTTEKSPTCRRRDGPSTSTPRCRRPAAPRRAATSSRRRPTRASTTSSRRRGRPDDVHVVRRRPTPRARSTGGCTRSTGRSTPWRGATPASFVKRSPAPVLEAPDGDPAGPRRPVPRVAVAAVRRAVPHRGLPQPRHRRQPATRSSPGDRAEPGGVADRPPRAAAADAQRGRPVRVAGPAHRRGKAAPARWSDWGHFRVVEPAATQTSPAAGRARSRRPTRCSPGRRSPAPRATASSGGWSGTTSIVEPVTTARALVGAAAGDHRRQLGVAGDRHRRGGQQPDAVDLAAVHGRRHRRGDHRPCRSAARAGSARRSRSPLRPRGTSAAAVTTTYQWFRGTHGDRRRDRPDLHRDRRRPAARASRCGRPAPGPATSPAPRRPTRSPGISGNAPVAVTGVTVSGTGKVGTSLTATPPVWDNDAVTTTYQWQRDGVNISGATATTLHGRRGGRGQGADHQGDRHPAPATTRARRSATRSPALLGDAPAATHRRVRSTAPTTRSAPPGRSPRPTWNTTGVAHVLPVVPRRDRDHRRRPATTYKLAAADIGTSVTVRATGTKAGYQPGTSTSNAVVAEQLDTLDPDERADDHRRRRGPRDPDGRARASWPSGSTYTYQWFVNGLAVAKETRSTYVVRTRDAGLPVSVRVTASKTGFLPGRGAPAPTSGRQAGDHDHGDARRRRRSPSAAAAVLLVHVDVLDLGVPLGKVQVKDGSKVLAHRGVKTDSRRRPDDPAQEAASPASTS